MRNLDRHSIPETVKNLIRVAIAHNVIDAVEVYPLALRFEDNWKELVTELCEIGFTLIHTNLDAHRAVVQAAEKYWQLEDEVNEILELVEEQPSKFEWELGDLEQVTVPVSQEHRELLDREETQSSDDMAVVERMCSVQQVRVQPSRISPPAEKKDVTVAAKEIRALLKKTYPGVRFSVKSRRYTGNSSVEIWWTDGPTGTEVEELTKGFRGWHNGYRNDYVEAHRSVSLAAMTAATEAAVIYHGLGHTPEIKTNKDGKYPYCEDYTRVEARELHGKSHTEPVCDQIHRACHNTSTYQKELIAETFAGAFPN